MKGQGRVIKLDLVQTRVGRILNSIFDKTANSGTSLADTVPANPLITLEAKMLTHYL